MYRSCLSFLALAGLAFVAAGCGGDTDKMVWPPASPNAALINARPGDYIGQDVKIEGLVKRIYRPGIFTVGRPETPEQEDLLVLGQPDRRTGPVVEGDLIRVTGSVQIFDHDMQSRFAPSYGLGGEYVDPMFYERWSNRPAIDARRIEKLRFPAVGGRS